MTDALTPAPKKRITHSWKTIAAKSLEESRQWARASDMYQAERDEARIDADHQREIVRHWQEDSAKWYRAFKTAVRWGAIVAAVLLVALIVALA